MTIYIVTEGMYSDYGIVAVFTEREPAERFVRMHNAQSSWGDADIEEWEGYSEMPPSCVEYQAFWRWPWQDWRGNSTDEVQVTEHWHWGEYAESAPEFAVVMDEEYGAPHQYWLIRTRGTDRERVVKYVSDRRAQIKALQEMQ